MLCKTSNCTTALATQTEQPRHLTLDETKAVQVSLCNWVKTLDRYVESPLLYNALSYITVLTLTGHLSSDDISP